MPQFPADLVEALLAKHGLPHWNIEKGEFEGVVNEVWFAGDVVVRINKDLNYESDVWTELVAVPALTAAGIRTPELLVFDSDLDIVPRLVTIYERVPGMALSKTDHLVDPERFFFELGQVIRSFHDGVLEVDDPNNRLDPEWTIKMDSFWENLGSMLPEVADALPKDLEFDSAQPKVFCHQDLHPDNIMVHEGRLAAVIDWGDAGWCDRSVDLRYIPARFLSAALAGYGEPSDAVRRNLLIHQLDQFMYCQREGRSYGMFGDSAREDVLLLHDLVRR